MLMVNDGDLEPDEAEPEEAVPEAGQRPCPPRVVGLASDREARETCVASVIGVGYGRRPDRREKRLAGSAGR